MIIKYADIRTRVKDMRRNGLPRGPEVGIDNLSDLWRPDKKKISLVTGIPNHGKSPLIQFVQVALSLQYGWKHALYSPESFPIEQFFNSLVEIYLGTSQDVVNDSLYSEGAAFIDDHFHFIYPDEDIFTLDVLLEEFQRTAENFGVDSVTIDPWNELEHKRPNWMTEHEYTGLAYSRYRKFCREYDAHGFLVAHPTKLQKKDDGSFPVPNPYSVSGSSNHYNKPDFCITVHRPHRGKEGADDYTEVHVQKVKNRNLGRLGMAELAYDWRSGRYAERGARIFNLPRAME